MTLSKIDDSLFVDIDNLTYAKFEERGSHSKAILKFSAGDTETLEGDSAKALKQRLEGGNGARSESSGDAEDFSPTERMKGWFFRRDASGRRLFLAFVSAKGSSSVRPFDADSGIAFPKQYRSGKWQQAFPDLLTGAKELTVKTQPNLERDCKQRLPQSVLEYLKKQVA